MAGVCAQSAAAALLFIDMNDMKAINDRFGHESGDAALKASARILQRICSENAFIMRYGGDEFIIIDSGKNPALCEELDAAADESTRTSGIPFILSLSIGVIRTTSDERMPLDECIRVADSLMYRNKQKKKAARKAEQPYPDRPE